jgi:hypothetical protein
VKVTISPTLNFSLGKGDTINACAQGPRSETILSWHKLFHLASKYLRRLPAAMRPESNISEMKAILATVPSPFAKVAHVGFAIFNTCVEVIRRRATVYEPIAEFTLHQLLHPSF